MKVGPRNAMVIAVVSLALRVGDELSAAFGSAGPVPKLVRAALDEVDVVPGARRRSGEPDRRRARHGARIGGTRCRC